MMYEITLKVIKAIPSITWTPPSEIMYGTPLSEDHLNATCVNPEIFRFSYHPDIGDILPAGNHMLMVTVEPIHDLNYSTGEQKVPIIISKVCPSITWDPPSDIIYGTPLNPIQLNATCTLSDKFTFRYPPTEGVVLSLIRENTS